MERFDRKYSAIVLGLTTCGLGVIRSLGKEHISIFGLDYEKKGRDAFYSKYAKTSICPHPVYAPEQLIKFMADNFADSEKKTILFPTADEFIKFISDYRDELDKHFLFNIPSREIIDSIIDKKIQYEFAEKSGVNIADTYYPETIEDVYNLQKILKYPLIIKGRYSFKWRERLGGTFKGFKITSENELIEQCGKIFEKKVSIIIQEVIPGPNTNHFKFCAYIDNTGKILAKFTLRKIRQYPVEFGVGVCVESIEYKELEAIGIKFFEGIGYKGIGSEEFKLDSQDKKLKLIELNPRYWMQNEQAAYCGVNFALAQYLDLTNQEVPTLEKFKKRVKWVEPVQDFKSFLQQPRQRRLSVFHWLGCLLSCKIFSVFSWHDLKPFLKSLDFGIKFFRLPWFLFKVITEHGNKNSANL